MMFSKNASPHRSFPGELPYRKDSVHASALTVIQQAFKDAPFRLVLRHHHFIKLFEREEREIEKVRTSLSEVHSLGNEAPFACYYLRRCCTTPSIMGRFPEAAEEPSVLLPVAP